MSFSFTLNGTVVTVDNASPTTTVLEWLRATGKTGTKEGCAEGDCGACTVAILDESSPQGATWRAVCSCIMLLPQVANRRIVTVEGLANSSTLHPAQKAMIDTLGSQCGYCTPGFIMSLFEATYRNDLDAPWKKDDQICGNLCRCTGYRPIRDALDEVAGACPVDQFSQALNSQPSSVAVDYRRGQQRFVRPTEWSVLWEALDEDDARIISGSTDLGLDITQRHIRFPLLIDVGGLPEIRAIKAHKGGWRLGAGVLLSDLEAWAADASPMMCKMLRFFASRQIKNRATLGGNLCNASPIGDLPPVLIALQAVAVIRSRKGERRVPFGGLDDGLGGFWTAYRKTALAHGEVLVAVELPAPRNEHYGSSYKVSKRRELDISAVSSAFVVGLDQAGKVNHARLAYGGMAATPSRAIQTERALLSQRISAATIEKACAALEKDFAPIDDHRGTAWYRREVAGNLLRGFFEELENQAPVTLPDRPSGTIFSGGRP